MTTCLFGKPVRSSVVSALAAITVVSMPQEAMAGTPQANANVRLVQAFLAKVRVATFQRHDPREIREVTERYLRPDYVQHSEGMKPGREGYIESMARLARGDGLPGRAMPSPQDRYWIADGDKVVWVSSIQLPGRDKPEFMFNMMRIENGRIAEHWGK